MRKPYIRLAAMKNAKFMMLYFDTAVSTCIERNETRLKDKVSEETILKMAEKMKPDEITNTNFV